MSALVAGQNDLQTGSYTLSGFAKLDITLIGAGGAGGNGRYFNGGAFDFRTGAGGGAGELVTVPTIYANSPLTATIGIGGLRGDNSGNNGSDGTNTSVVISTNTYTAQSGKGGKGGDNATFSTDSEPEQGLIFTVAEGGDGGAPGLKGGHGATFNNGIEFGLNGHGSQNGANSTDTTGRGMGTGAERSYSSTDYYRKGGGGAALPTPYNTGGGNGANMGGNINAQTYGAGGGGGQWQLASSGGDPKGGNGFNGRALVNVTYLNTPTITSFASTDIGQLTLNYSVNDAILSGYSAQLYLNGSVYGSAQTGTITGTTGTITFNDLPGGLGFTVKIKATPDNGLNYTSETTSTTVGPWGIPPNASGVVQNISTATADIVLTSIPTLKYKLTVLQSGSVVFTSQEFTANSTTLTIPITGLTLNTTYEYQMIVSSQYSTSMSYSTLSNFTTLNVISPSIASPIAGDGTLEVNFTPATQGAGITVTEYTVSLSPGTASQNIIADGPYKANFTGLTNGVTYTATVTVNATSGSAFATATGIPNGPPAAPSFNVYIPTNPVTAEGNSNELKIDYSFSASGSPYVTSYDVILTPVGGTAFDDINVANTIQSVLINPTTQPLIKLIAGQAYSIIVRANSANGSTSSLPKEATPTGSAESATITSVVADNKKITVHFSASATPSEHLESYIVVLTPTGGSNLRSDPIPVTSASTYSYTFEGLTNYLEHTAKVIAKGNADVVNGTEINSTTLIASPTGPDAPTLVRAEASQGQNTIPASGNAIVSFNHSVVPLGGSLIEGYTVTASPGGATATGSASPLTVSGLTNGNEYTFTVTAKNALQNVSEPSLASLGVTPTSVPDAPTLVSAVAGDHTVTITFTAPTNTGGANVSSYSVFCDDNLSERSETASSSPFVYPNLQNGKEYTFSVCANNYNGSSASSSSLKATPASLAVRELMNENVNVIPDVETFIQSVAELTINDGGLVKFTELGVDLSVLTTDEDKKKITKKLINSVFEAKTELNNFMVEKSSFPIVSSNAKDNILVVKANEPFEITKLESTTSIYVAIETVGDSNTFIIGTDEFTIEKTSLGYNFIYNNTTTSHIDGGETRVGDLLIIFGGGSVSFDPLNNSTPHCYARGTLIGTSRGWVPIEDLLMSDKLRSYDLIKESMFKPVGGVPFKALVRVEDTRFKNRFAGIKFIGKFTVNSMNKNTAPIRITAGALGENKPERDLLVSPNHSMLISNRLIFAKFLVNGSTIYQDMSFNKIEYFHVLSDDHYIISANGALSETLGTEEFKLFETMIYAQSQIYQPLASENKYSFTEMAF